MIRYSIGKDTTFAAFIMFESILVYKYCIKSSANHKKGNIMFKSKIPYHRIDISNGNIIFSSQKIAVVWNESLLSIYSLPSFRLLYTYHSEFYTIKSVDITQNVIYFVTGSFLADIRFKMDHKFVLERVPFILMRYKTHLIFDVKSVMCSTSNTLYIITKLRFIKLSREGDRIFIDIDPLNFFVSLSIYDEIIERQEYDLTNPVLLMPDTMFAEYSLKNYFDISDRYVLTNTGLNIYSLSEKETPQKPGKYKYMLVLESYLESIYKPYLLYSHKSKIKNTTDLIFNALSGWIFESEEIILSSFNTKLSLSEEEEYQCVFAVFTITNMLRVYLVRNKAIACVCSQEIVGLTAIKWFNNYLIYISKKCDIKWIEIDYAVQL